MIIEVLCLTFIIFVAIEAAKEKADEIISGLAIAGASFLLLVVFCLILSPETITLLLIIFLSFFVVVLASVKSYILGFAYAVMTVIPVLRYWVVYGIILAVLAAVIILFAYDQQQKSSDPAPPKEDMNIPFLGLVLLVPSACLVSAESVPSWLVFGLTVSLFFVFPSHKLALLFQSVLLLPIGQCWPKQALVLILVFAVLAVTQFYIKVQEHQEEKKKKEAEKAQAEKEKKEKRRKYLL